MRHCKKTANAASAAEMRGDLESLGVGRGISLRRLSRWFLAVALLGVVAAGVWLCLQSLSHVALTNQDTVVLADFTNRTSDPVLGDALDTAVRTELEQTPFLNILSSSKVRGALRQTGHSEDAKLTMEMARDICAQSNSKAVAGGSITDAGNHYRLELKAVGCQSGKTLATTEAGVGNRNEIVRMLGVAGIELRRKFGEPKESLRNFSKPLDEATSALPEALQAYTEGIRGEPQRLTDALPHFKRATEIDPDYAVAYAWQAALGSGDVPMTAATKAYKITPSGTLTTLYTFCSQIGCTDGTQPYAGVIQATDGNFYGTTELAGGSTTLARSTNLPPAAH